MTELQSVSPTYPETVRNYKLATHPDKQENFSENDGSVSENNVRDDIKKGSNTVVHDKLKLVFLIFVLHGIGILMPWNMFITANSYFVDFKLNVNDPSMEQNRKNFLIYVGIAANIPNVLFNALNIFVQFGSSTLGIRIIGALIIEIIIFFVTIILAMVNTTSWVGVFFGITMTSVVIINMANGVYQNSVYGLAAMLPMEYTMAVILGTNISGTFTAAILILSIAAYTHPRTGAIYYFLTALIVLLFCLDTFLALPLNKFYQYYDKLSKKFPAENVEQAVTLSPFQTFRKIWPQCLNVFMVFFVTLTIFPAMCANTKIFDYRFFIDAKYFTAITCFLSFNFFAMVGSFLPSCFKWPEPKYLWIPIVIRFLLIPFFMLCNYIPESRTLPVLIKNDYAYTVMVTVLGLSSGYCSSLAMMYTPGYVSKENKTVAGMIAAFFLVFGVFCGVNFTFFVRWLVQTL
ncbi:equilibrative nucleoside transporter 1-like [Parasteatoda tepidariorum]|nr:equilibrative nucleoside transporter 1-like [Parasteatoda tepidariorum]